MSNFESSNFTSIVPLVADGFFSPPYWDNILQYNFIDITLVADTKCAIYVIQSPDRINAASSIILESVANVPFTVAIPNYSRYLQIRVYNLEGVQQQKFSLQTIYKQISTVQNNLIVWNNATISNNSYSASIPILSSKNISVYGNSSGAATLSIQFSMDNQNFYTSQYSYNISSSGNFGFSSQSAAPFVRLIRTDAGTDVDITAIISSC